METPDLSHAIWRKSHRSNATGCCVEVAAGGLGVAIRDSKAPDGPILTVTPNAWRALTQTLKAGDAGPR